MKENTDIKTIADRWNSLTEWEEANGKEVILHTEATETRNGWMAETTVIIDGEAVANDFIEKHFSECGQSTLSTASTQSKSRAIAVFLREANVYSKEELDEVRRHEQKAFSEFLKANPKEAAIKSYIRTFGPEIRTALNKVYNDHLAELVNRAATTKSKA